MSAGRTTVGVGGFVICVGAVGVGVMEGVSVLGVTGGVGVVVECFGGTLGWGTRGGGGTVGVGWRGGAGGVGGTGGDVLDACLKVVQVTLGRQGSVEV